MSRVYVVAELGSSHGGNMQRAMKLVEIAKDCGANCVKAQFWSDGRRLAARRGAKEFESIYEAGEVSFDWLKKLSAFALSLEVDFGCSTYLPEDVWKVAEISGLMKIASFEAEDPHMLAAHRGPLAAGKRIVISLGMGGDRRPSETFLRQGIYGRVEYLDCVSSYPAPAEELCLSGLRWLPVSSGFDGLSDHTTSNPIVAATAVGAGALVIERHVRLDDTPVDNPDYAHSSSPEQFRDYVDAVRFAEAAMFGDRLARASEEQMRKYKVKK